MSKAIPIELGGTAEIEIDGALVAQGLGLDVARFRQLLEQRRITQLCERGTGEDAGLYRASFYHAGTRVRLVVDSEGTPVPGTFSVEGPAAGGAAGAEAR